MSSATNPFIAFQEAEALLAAGELKQAADICRSMLNNYPDFPYGYYLMSSLFHATGTYNNALTFSQMAIDKEPNIAAFHIRQGQILFSIGDNQAAAAAFENAHKLEPKNPVPLLLWADALAQQGRFDDAKTLFVRARKAGDIPEIDLHEGLCHAMRGAWQEAEQLFDRAIARAPDDEWGYLQKGKVLFERKCIAEAEACFARALKCNPKAYEALHGMALVSEHQGQMDMAIRYAMDAIQSNPRGWESHMHLGSMLVAREQYDMAEQVLRQACGLQPDNPYALQLLFTALYRQHKTAEAKQILDTALTANPDHQVLRYFQGMMSGESVESAPQHYISSLFDGYADRFDHHLQQVLGYKVPALLAEMVASLTTARDMSLLDLGCGTGLAAEAFRDITSQRVGVDLSPKMIVKARTRQLYNALYAQDIVKFMQSCEEHFDLVTAADVLVYIGDLAPVFKAVRGVLARDGLMVFSVEKEEGIKDYALKPTGRYTHAPAYIARLAAAEGYAIVHQQDITIRNENGLPVAGIVYALKKTVMH